MHATAQPTRLGRLLVVLAVTLLARPALAADPTAASFRKLAAAAEKQARKDIGAQVVAAKAGLKTALSEYKQGGTALPGAMAGAVTATRSAISLMTTAVVDLGVSLRDDGADLLTGFVGQVGPDLLDGGGGGRAWDRYKHRTEDQLVRADKKIRAAFGKFAKGATKVAKSQGFDPDVRWRVSGHDRTPLDAIEGPAITALRGGAPEGVDLRSLQVTIEVRYLTVEEGFLQDIGVDLRGLDAIDVHVMDDAGNELQDLGRTPDTTGSFSSRATLDNAVTGPLLTSLFDSDALDLLIQTIGSRSTAAVVSKPQLIQFRQSLSQELSFAKKFVRENTRDAVMALNDGVKTHAQGTLDTAVAIRGALSTTGFASGNDRLLLGAIQNNPVNNAASEFQSDALTDADVSAQFVPDGQADYTRFLERLNRTLFGADRARGRALQRSVDKIVKRASKQGEEVAVVLDVRPRAAQVGIQLNIVPNVVSDPLERASVDMAVLVRVDDAISGAFAGEAKPSLAAAMPTTEEIGGIVLGGVSFGEQFGNFVGQVPVLGDLPVLGALFRNRSTTSMREDLMILVTPRIVME